MITGHPRCCGWLHTDALKSCYQINGFLYLDLIKLDVLFDPPEIKLGISYREISDKVLDLFPSDLGMLE
jgi:adenylosuccinate synthase